MRRSLLRGVATIAALSLLIPAPAFAQAPPAPPPAMEASATQPGVLYNTEQLDAMLAQIALYPDNLLAQILMAATYPLQVVQAARWLDQGNNKALSGDALVKALEPQPWDPSVKSLVPFPQVLGMLNGNLDWTQELGYAFANQQNDVWNSVQRLRAQAQSAGQLKTTQQQVVAVESGAIVIQPADPQVVYVPAYNPSVVYGSWPYPSSPPVYYPPPPLYPYGAALATGIAFAAGVAVVGSLWGWANPVWRGGYGGWGGSVNVNANRYNNINVNRPPLPPGGWRPPAAGGAGGLPNRPPGGPVGMPGRPGQLPANAIGRPNVQVPGNLARPGGPGSVGGPGRPGGPGSVGGPGRPGGPGSVGGPGRPGGPGSVGGAGGVGRPGGPGAANVQRPSQQPRGAFGGVNDGARAGQYGQRGAQSRSFQQNSGSMQQNRGGGAQMRAAPSGGGGARAGGGGGRGGGGGGRGGRR